MNLSKGFFFTILVFLSGLIPAQSSKILTLKNHLDLTRKAQSVEIPYKKVKAFFGQSLTIEDKRTHAELPYQWLGNKNLLIQADFLPKEKKNIRLNTGGSKVINLKVYGRYVPERYGDFAWENDRVAFRMYGKALEPIAGQNAWGLDVWSKRTSKMIIDEWYKLDNYHHDNGDGLDFYKVGFTLGAGDVLPFLKGKLTYLGNYTTSRIIENGPIRFTFELDYPAVDREGYSISATKRISLDAGAQLNRFEVSYQFRGENTLPVFVGTTYHNGKGQKMLASDESSFVGYWPEEESNGAVATAVVFIKEKNKTGKVQDLNGHLGKIIEAKNLAPIVFFAGGVWDKAGFIKNANDWKSYLTDMAKELNSPIEVK